MQKNSLVYALVASISGILFGFDTGVISGAILFIRDDFQLSVLTESFLMSAVLIGAFAGALVSSRMADLFGRRRILIYIALIFIAGTLISAEASTIPVLISGRILIGVATGISAYLSPLYISELAPAKYRGFLVSLNQLALVSGILLSYMICYAFSFSGSWRGMFLVGVLPALGLFAGLFYLPESPRWLVRKNQLEAARAALNKIYASNDEVNNEIKNIQQLTREQNAGWKSILTFPINKTLFIACSLTAIQQITGINTILYFAPTILQMSGLASHQASLFATVGIGIFLVAFTIVTINLIDKVGRKKLLYIGLSLMALGLSLMILVFANDAMLAKFALIGMCVYIAGFALALGSVVWLMIVEVFPLEVRGLGASVATSVNWFFNWLVTFSFLFMLNQFGKPGVFSVYLFFTLVSILLVYFYIPETKNVSLEVIEDNLYKGYQCKQLGYVEN